jgi:membrane-associated protease RseP (regulator of RpoE activity)
MDFLINNLGTILFYTFIGLLIYFNRKKFEFQGIIGMYKTKFGISYMQKMADKYPKTLTVLGTIGIWVGYLGMIAILVMVIYSVYQLIYNPSAPPAFTPVFPGFQVPGGPKIPLVQGLIALFVVVVIHEFAHGVISKLYKIKIKSSGFALLGPIPAAFVEPDQKALEKASPKKQLAIYAAGPFSNVLLGILMILIINLGLILTAALYAPSGVIIHDFNETDERLSEFSKGEIINFADNEPVKSAFDLQNIMQNKTPGQTINLNTNLGEKQILLTNHPNNETIGYLGFTLDQNVQGKGRLSPILDIIQKPYFWIVGNPYDIRQDPFLGWIGKSLFGWIYILTIGIGLVNLLPIGPVDGGRMIKVALDKFFKKETALKIWAALSYFLIAIILVLLFVPIIRNVL